MHNKKDDSNGFKVLFNQFTIDWQRAMLWAKWRYEALGGGCPVVGSNAPRHDNYGFITKERNMKLTTENFSNLENSYLLHFPSDIPDEILQDYKTIIEYHRFIRNIIPDKRILNNLLDITIEKIKTRKRFQRINFIKLIYSQINLDFADRKISEKLFFVFQSLITVVNDDIKWKLSVTIKDIELSQKNIDWLIENWEISEHIQNRLLLYPTINKQISKWGERCFAAG